MIFGIGMVGWTIYIGISSNGSCVDNFISVVLLILVFLEILWVLFVDSCLA